MTLENEGLRGSREEYLAFKSKHRIYQALLCKEIGGKDSCNVDSGAFNVGEDDIMSKFGFLAQTINWIPHYCVTSRSTALEI